MEEGYIYAKKDEPIYGCGDLDKADIALSSYVPKTLIPRRIRNKVKAISFFTDGPVGRALAAKDTEQLRETSLVDKSAYPLPAEIDVYEDKIAMLTFNRRDFIGILVENQDIATTLKSIFRLAFRYAPKQPLHEPTA